MAMLFLLERPWNSPQTMGAAGRELVETQYTPEAHYRGMLSLYERMLAAASKGRNTEKRDIIPAPIRVAFIGGRGVVSKYSGIETYYEEVGQRLVEMGHDVTVYCRSYFTPPMTAYKGMRVVRLPTFRSKHLETLVHTLLSTVRVMLSPCDVVHYQALGPALFSFLPRLVGKKNSSGHGSGTGLATEEVGKVQLLLVLATSEKLLLRGLPDRTMVVSRTLEQHYANLCIELSSNLCAKRVRNPRAGVAPERLFEWGLEPNSYILFLGRLSRKELPRAD